MIFQKSVFFLTHPIVLKNFPMEIKDFEYDWPRYFNRLITPLIVGQFRCSLITTIEEVNGTQERLILYRGSDRASPVAMVDNWICDLFHYILHLGIASY